MHITPISPNIPMSDSRENTPTFSFFYHHYYHHYGLINIHIHSIILYVDYLIHTLVTASPSTPHAGKQRVGTQSGKGFIRCSRAAKHR
ncbi:hypothetical protein CKAH01_13956 [Colletotrichum kahawae]|uniref:Uncharacterized protein n=1 Tax=Colletotrichum kahawae TaxID=34407 RepID=A0AAD9YNA1_COLKA|nr:hypothetical protein CKAH01_13956 [Colletotrichum kahawae]